MEFKATHGSEWHKNLVQNYLSLSFDEHKTIEPPPSDKEYYKTLKRNAQNALQTPKIKSSLLSERELGARNCVTISRQPQNDRNKIGPEGYRQVSNHLKSLQASSRNPIPKLSQSLIVPDRLNRDIFGSMR